MKLTEAQIDLTSKIIMLSCELIQLFIQAETVLPETNLRETIKCLADINKACSETLVEGCIDE